MQAMPLLSTASIKIENRFRKHMGDLKPLMESIRALGLLHPIVVNEHHRLIAGARRLEACKRLGWTEIPSRVVNLNELELRAEFDENFVRENLPHLQCEAIHRPRDPQI